ncbi:hypothetical protein HPB50_006709 [Hyalomma asiaticum]|uniref:Uncharacterized protein n=1 Tax=Hyalomma asiaticum TaxID=266040 RepID=A0ACB7TFW6_HYAAI|nr:hypothetical protein HPB50_006709 [Hyalomma asiaticum]
MNGRSLRLAAEDSAKQELVDWLAPVIESALLCPRDDDVASAEPRSRRTIHPSESGVRARECAPSYAYTDGEPELGRADKLLLDSVHGAGRAEPPEQFVPAASGAVRPGLDPAEAIRDAGLIPPRWAAK